MNPPDPYEFGRATYVTGAQTVIVPVVTPTGAGDALVLAIAVAGAVADVASVEDSRGNAWALIRYSTARSPRLSVWAATGETAALETGAIAAPTEADRAADTVTVTLDQPATANSAILGGAFPGVETLDLNESAGATSAVASVSGTPRSDGQAAIAAYAWPGNNAIGVDPPFIQLGQVVSNSQVTLTYCLGPPSGEVLTASYRINSTAWRTVLASFEAVRAPVRAWDGAAWAEGELKGWAGSAWAPARVFDGAGWTR